MSDANELILETQTDIVPKAMTFWPALLIKRARIEAEVERLQKASLSPGALRQTKIVHPQSEGVGRGLAPGIDVSINVVNPGESTTPYRQNASQISFCIAGSGTAHIAAEVVRFSKHDVWNAPSMKTVWHENSGDTPAVFLTYSNAPLLQKLEVHFIEESPPEYPPNTVCADQPVSEKERSRDSALRVACGDQGAEILGYEYLVDIDVIASQALHWPWTEIDKHMDGLENLGGVRGKGYQGRHLAVLYNPATERRMGTSHCFFASIAQFPPGRVDAPHRHTSAAINYIFGGSGRSTVEGRKFDWDEGDLMLSAPGWATHNHASGDQGCKILTIQDHPLQIAMESLIWQEDLKGPIVKLGAEQGAQTNIKDLAEA